MIHSDSTVLSGHHARLSPGNQAPTTHTEPATPTHGGTRPDTTKRKRSDSSDPLVNVSLSRPHSVDNGTNTQNLLAEYLQNAEQQIPESRRAGRKPLHYRDQLDDDDEDPKVKRKVQNRAAQRAFRERKERYVRELEIKIRQIEMNHMQVASQLAQENQYLRLAVHRLKTELSTIKGIPYESMQDMMPALDQWHQQVALPMSPMHLPAAAPAAVPEQQQDATSDLAPFLTMSSQSMVQSVASAPIVSAPPRVRSLAPASRASLEKKRPVPILPQQQQQRPGTELSRPYTTGSSCSPSSSSTASASASSSSSSVAALYVRFSPQERPQDTFTIVDPLRTDSYLTAQPLFEHYNDGGDNHSSAVKQLDQVEKATAVLDNEESTTTRMQTVWRRLNLYGRFAEFDFDQLCRVAQIADGNPALQRIPIDGARADPSIEDWELDKLMHQMDPDHL